MSAMNSENSNISNKSTQEFATIKVDNANVGLSQIREVGDGWSTNARNVEDIQKVSGELVITGGDFQMEQVGRMSEKCYEIRETNKRSVAAAAAQPNAKVRENEPINNSHIKSNHNQDRIATLDAESLTKNLDAFCRNMMSIQVISLLEGSGVITSVEADDLRVAVGRSAYSGNQEIITLVRKRGSDALHAFHSALEATAQKELAYLLRAT